MKTNIILFADPHIGKSTVLKKFLSTAIDPITGLITLEIKDGDKRVGFRMGHYYHHTEDEVAFASIIAHINFDSSVSVSKYKVDLEHLRLESLQKFRECLRDETLLYLDEIGEMQLHSQVFKELVEKYLNAPNICIATLSNVYDSDFIKEIRERDDVILIEVTMENRDTLHEFLATLVSKMKKAKKYALQPERFKREGNYVEFVSDSNKKRIINLMSGTCLCEFYYKHKALGYCSHIDAAQSVFKYK
jgi:nucleoside-triphosphatase